MKAILSFAFLFSVTVLTAADEKKLDPEKIVGTWKVTEGKKNGTAIGDDGKKGLYVIKKDKIHIQEDGKDMFVMTYTIDAKASPATIDMEIKEAPVKEIVGSKGIGIVELDGDTFKICYDPEGKNRPKKFDDDKAYSFTLKREKDAKKEEKKKDK